MPKSRLIGRVLVREPTIKVLRLLKEAAYQNSGEQRCIRVEMHSATHGALLKHRWAYRTSLDGYLEWFWTITERGLRLLEAWDRGSSHRFDGKCPDCEKNDKLPNQTYCRLCRNKRSRDNEAYRKAHYPRRLKYRKDGMCPKCSGQRPRTEGRSYCQECDNERAREYQRRKKEQVK